jgi:hypothetical protein
MSRDLNQYQRDYAASPFEETMAGLRKRILVEFLVKGRFRNIVEVGCGQQPLFETCPDFESFTVVEPGVAFFEKAQAAARRHKNPASIHLVNRPFEDFEPSPSLLPDCIIISSLLHEIPVPKTMVEHAFRIAPVGCRLHVNVPNAKSFHRLWAKEAGLIKNEYEKSATQIRMQQSHTFDLESLSSLARDCGFSIVESGSYFIKPFAHAQMERLMELGILTDDLIGGLMKMERYLPGLGAEIFVNARK